MKRLLRPYRRSRAVIDFFGDGRPSAAAFTTRLAMTRQAGVCRG